MAEQEGSGNSVSVVATSSPTPLINWWDLQATSLSSWNNNGGNSTWNNHPNPDSNSSSCEDQDISVSTSFTNASNHSTLTVESPRTFIELPPSSSNSLMAEQPSDNHLWSHILLGVGSNNELQNSQVGENFVDALSSKSMTSTMFEPACNYLKKLDDTSWEYSNNNSTSFNSFEKHHQNGYYSQAMLENERLSKLSNLVSTWSIAPPGPEVNHNTNSQFDPQITHDSNITLSSSMDHSGMFCYNGLGMKVKHEHHHHHESEVPGAIFGRSCNNSTIGYQNGYNSLAGVGDNGRFHYGMPSLSSCTRNLTDVISFAGIGIHALKPTLKSLNVSESKKQGLQTSFSQSRINNGRGQGSNATEAKKKRTEDSAEAILKKPKQETSTASSTKAPKVKLGDRITTLQQIVSPFGKTDTASVLFEAIGYIKFLQEQVQLLSNSYVKTNSHKDAWGSLDKKDKGDGKGDLRTRGLCLVPISCTPQVCRENTGPDYWTPAYRGCLYR